MTPAASGNSAPPQNSSFDPGLTQQYAGPLLRTINKDGSFNVQRQGFTSLTGNIYLHLVNMSWPKFLGLVTIVYLVVNTVFAVLYLSLGPAALHASERDPGMGYF